MNLIIKKIVKNVVVKPEGLFTIKVKPTKISVVVKGLVPSTFVCPNIDGGIIY